MRHMPLLFLSALVTSFACTVPAAPAETGQDRELDVMCIFGAFAFAEYSGQFCPSLITQSKMKALRGVTRAIEVAAERNFQNIQLKPGEMRRFIQNQVQQARAKDGQFCRSVESMLASYKKMQLSKMNAMSAAIRHSGLSVIPSGCMEEMKRRRDSPDPGLLQRKDPT